MSTVLSARAWETVWTYRATFVQGLLNTLETAGIALVIALIIGFTLGLFSTSGHKALKAVARVYVEFFQNTPLILQVCFLYYVLAYSGMGLPVIVVGFISLGLYHGAYISEVVRSGIEAVPAGQFDAAHSQGFEYFGMMRYIILPQTVRIILPPMGNQVVSLIKNLLPVHRRRRGSHCFHLQFRHRRQHRRRIRPRLSGQRTDLFRDLLSPVHVGGALGGPAEEAHCRPARGPDHRKGGDPG